MLKNVTQHILKKLDDFSDWLYSAFDEELEPTNSAALQEMMRENEELKAKILKYRQKLFTAKLIDFDEYTKDVF